MVLISYSGREINAKLVYYGPGLSGKTTNLEYIYGAIPQTHRGKMVSMKTKTERTLFFDFLPIDLGELAGFKTRFLLYTVPGQVYYNATRKLVLKGVDAVVFVADSKRGKMDENIESLQNLRDNLKEQGIELDKMPWVLQYNKRDLADTYSIDELQRSLNPTRTVPSFEAIGTTGVGVFETFKGVSRLLLKHLSREIGVRVIGAQGGEAEAQATAEPPRDPSSPMSVTETSSTPQRTVSPTAEPGLPNQAFSGSRSAAPTARPSIPRAPRADSVAVRPPSRAGTEEPVTLHATPGPIEDATPQSTPPVPTANDVDFEHDRLVAPSDEPPIRMPGMGDRLRRWLGRSREFEESGSSDPTTIRTGPPISSPPPGPEMVPGPRPMQPGGVESVHSTEDAVDPGIEKAPEPFVEPQDDEPVPVKLTPVPPRPMRTPVPIPSTARQEDKPVARSESLARRDLRPVVREVPITIEIDPEDLERGVVVRLLVRARRGETTRDDGAGTGRARAA